MIVRKQVGTGRHFFTFPKNGCIRKKGLKVTFEDRVSVNILADSGASKRRFTPKLKLPPPAIGHDETAPVENAPIPAVLVPWNKEPIAPVKF